MKKISFLKQLLFLGFSFVAVVSFIGGLGYYFSNNLLNKLVNISTTQLPAEMHMKNIDMLHDNFKGLVYQSIVMAENNNIEGLKEAVKDKDTAIKNLEADLDFLSKSNLKENTKKVVDDVKPVLKAYYVLASELVDSSAKGNYKTTIPNLPMFNSKFKELESKIEDLGKVIESDATETTDEGRQSLTILAAITLIAALTGLASFFIMIKRMSSSLKYFITQLSGSTIKVKEVSQKLSAANVQLSGISTETASSLEETVASLDELTSMVTLNSENAQNASQSSEQSRLAAESGERQINSLSSAMLEIKSSSKKMEEIINVIDDIAFQTNLLALNAAVEAARAGEQGKGFAVVADAVRTLAQRSASAAKDINVMIKESIGQIDNGSNIAQACSESLNQIFKSVKTVADLNNQIASASFEQSSGIKQISAAMNQLDTTSQQNASASEEVASGANEVYVQAENLSDLVERINSEILGEKVIRVGSSVESEHQVKSDKKLFSPSSKSSNVISLSKSKKIEKAIPMGSEPSSREIKKVENF